MCLLSDTSRNNWEKGVPSMKIRLIAVLLAALMIAAPILGAVGAQAQPTTITIGALLPLTGDLQSYGERAKAAVEVAVDEMNAYLEQENAWFRLQLIVEDTQTKPDVAVQKFNALVAQNVKFIVGPMTSAEVKKLKDLADQNNVLIISPSSTAIELAIPGDNVFRFCPADDVQSQAIGALANDLGLKAVVIINRADTWGNGLKDATVNILQDEGIEVVNVYSYNPESPGFTGIASSANNDVKALLDNRGYKPADVAIIAIGFNEVVQLFKEAQKYEYLAKVPWIGSDGTAMLSEFTQDPVAAKFGTSVLFINPIFSPAASDVQDKVKQAVQAKIGQEPDAYALAAHDAVVAITLALLQAGPTDDPDAMVNAVKQMLPEITTSDEFAQFAATGKFPLNDAGDRGTADYDWFMIMNVDGKAQWVKAGVYKGIENKNYFDKLPNGKTYLEMFQARFAVTGEMTEQPKEEAPAQQEQPQQQEQAPAAEQPAEQEQPATEQPQQQAEEGGMNTALIAAVIIIIVAIAIIALRMRS